MACCGGNDVKVSVGELVTVQLKPGKGALTILTLNGKLERIAAGKPHTLPKVNAIQYGSLLEIVDDVRLPVLPPADEAGTLGRPAQSQAHA